MKKIVLSNLKTTLLMDHLWKVFLMHLGLVSCISYDDMVTTPAVFMDGKVSESYDQKIKITSPALLTPRPSILGKGVLSCNLPPGLSLKLETQEKHPKNIHWLHLVGTPSKAGVYKFFIKVVDGRHMMGYAVNMGAYFEVTIAK